MIVADMKRGGYDSGCSDQGLKVQFSDLFLNVNQVGGTLGSCYVKWRI